MGICLAIHIGSRVTDWSWVPPGDRHYRGRGAFESMGAGIEMQPGDIAFKSNFATLDPSSGIVTSRRADRHFEDVGPLFCADLTGAQHPWSCRSISYSTPCCNFVALPYPCRHKPCGANV